MSLNFIPGFGCGMSLNFIPGFGCGMSLNFIPDCGCGGVGIDPWNDPASGISEGGTLVIPPTIPLIAFDTTPLILSPIEGIEVGDGTGLSCLASNNIFSINSFSVISDSLCIKTSEYYLDKIIFRNHAKYYYQHFLMILIVRKVFANYCLTCPMLWIIYTKSGVMFALYT
jgi:hypothetical protein